jgi:hypothetical protein
MAIFSGPEIPNNGLVFHYDMSNTVKSWRGAPVVNLAPYTDYSNRNYNTAYDIGGWGGDDADVFYYNSGGYNNLPYKKMVKHTGGTGGSYINEHGYFTLTEGVTYNISCYMRANVATTVSGHTLALNRDSDNAYRVPADIALTTDWVKQTWIYTCAVGEGGTTYHFRQIVYNDTQLPLEVYWCGLQISEGTISYPYVNGTRSNTQAILDLTGNNTVTASSLTYSSDGTFSFNGSSNLLVFPENSIMNTNSPTVEVWVKTAALSQNGFWFEKGTVNSSYSLFQEGSNIVWRTVNSGSTPYDNLLATTASYLSTSAWAHIVGTYTTGNKRIYINGVQVANNTASGTVATNTSGCSIGVYGGFNGSRGYWYNGSIGNVKVYNRALSAVEVQQNFEATRGRYGI